MTARRTTSGEFKWPPVDEELDTAGLYPIKEYIQWRKAAVEAQVACLTIYELFMVADRIPETSMFMRWWYQDVGQEVE